MAILDVREKEEFTSQYIEGSLSCPLSSFKETAKQVLEKCEPGEVTIMCRSGQRSKMALIELKQMGFNRFDFKVYEGGLLQWKKEGKPVVGEKSILPIMRQVQIVASSMILLAFVLGYFVSSAWHYLALLVGFGLALAGFTGICPMVYALEQMPWNKSEKTQEASNA